jgi:predicted ArsR family transcriptional regulator
MMDLFDPSLSVRRTDPDTSRDAAHKASTFAGEHHQKILSAIRDSRDGLTIHECADATGLDHVAVARRCPELERGGLIQREGRRTHKGRTGQVWKPAERG